jgi:6-pyruvoyltetrahydropterin/6-carboxytetrahydropterin synthase
MKATIYKKYQFEAAHRLPHVSEGHKCGRLHGHSFGVEVRIYGPVDEHAGWFMDLDALDSVIGKVIDESLDHRYLNEIQELENPTSENIARWLWRRCATNLEGLVEIRVAETCSSGCIYGGEE